MLIEVASSALERMIAEAASAAPDECCGILLGTDNRIDSALPARNVHPDPALHFEIDPQALIDAHRAARAGGPQVIGYYHSHPHGEAAPSATDQTLAAGDGSVWAIIGKEGARFWRDDAGGFAPLSYCATGS